MLFAYIGPETALPLTSILAAAVGMLLMFGRQVIRIPGLVWRNISGGIRRGPAVKRLGEARPHSADDGAEA